jgi:hypothetical protein
MELGLYRHKSGKFYQVFQIAKHAENLEDLVIYQALYGNYEIWAKPMSLFTENMTSDSGESVPTFSLITSDEQEIDETEEEEGSSYDADEMLLTVADNEVDLQRLTKKLEKNDIDFEVYEEVLDPKPKHLPSNTFYMINILEEDFDAAMEALNS